MHSKMGCVFCPKFPKGFLNPPQYNSIPWPWTSGKIIPLRVIFGRGGALELRFSIRVRNRQNSRLLHSWSNPTRKIQTHVEAQHTLTRHMVKNETKRPKQRPSQGPPSHPACIWGGLALPPVGRRCGLEGPIIHICAALGAGVSQGRSRTLGCVWMVGDEGLCAEGGRQNNASGFLLCIAFFMVSGGVRLI